jgi:hypothetical protein
LLHAKANTAPTTTSYNRRKAAADELRDTLNNSYFSTRNIILLGDFNDDLDVTIADGVTPNTTSYSAFTGEPANYFSPTLALSLAGNNSTLSYTNMIDHVMVSNEMQPFYMNSTASVLTDVTSLINSYGSSTSDHYPIFTRYAFDPAILPVTLGIFTVTKTDNAAKINWVTQTEINTSHFVVERSSDIRNWTGIATVAAKSNSSIATTYELYDNSPTKGINYYRLRIVDKDAKFAQSDIRSALFGSKNTVEVAPNPAHNFINLYIGKTTARQIPATIQLLNAAGKIVYSTLSAQHHIQISTATLAKGLYFAKVVTADGPVTIRVVVE